MTQVNGREGPESPGDPSPKWITVGDSEFTLRLEFSLGQAVQLSMTFEGGSADGAVTVSAVALSLGWDNPCLE